MQLRDFFLILLARWRIVVASVLVVLAATAFVTWTTTPTYTAQSRVYLSSREPDPEDESSFGVYAITAADLNMYVAVMGSPDVMEPLRERLGLPPGTPIDVSAVVDDKASILNITAHSADPALAADIANAMGPQLAAVAGKFSPLLRASGQEVEATTVSPAVAPSSPSSPNVTRNLALGLLAGLAIGVGLAFVRHTVDTKTRSDADISALSESPILGHLPMTKVVPVPEDGVALEWERHGHYAESVRRLRTNLMFVDVTTGRHAFVVTSAAPGDGKTTTAVNLAAAIADAGTRVLLVDADLRNPSVGKKMGLESNVGLTTVLLGQISPEEAIQPWRDTNLSVLTAGEIPPNPSELLGSEPMEQLFAKLHHDFDFIVIDSPPVLPVIDAVVLDRYTAGMLLVVAMDRTRKRDLATSIRSLETAGVKVSGFALNMVPSRADAYGYGGYGYGYGKAEAAQTPTEHRRSRRRARKESDAS